MSGATPKPEDVAAFGAQLHALGEVLSLIVESVAGYRAKLEAAGFSPTAAERGAIDYHRELLASAMRSKP